MNKKILWATDGSQGADVALREARRLARMNAGRILAVHADRPSAECASDPAPAAEHPAVSKLRHQVEQLRQMGVDIDLLVCRPHDDAANLVAALAEELDAEVIVCGAGKVSARGDALLGGFAQRLVQARAAPSSPFLASLRPDAERRVLRDPDERRRLPLTLGARSQGMIMVPMHVIVVERVAGHVA